MPVKQLLINNKLMSIPNQMTPEDKLLYGIKNKKINIPKIQNNNSQVIPINTNLLNTENSLNPNQTLNVGSFQLIPEENKINSNSDTNFLSSLLGQGVAMLGAGIQGRSVGDVAEQFDYQRELNKRREIQKQQQDEQKKQLEDLMNPDSAVSKAKKNIYSKALGVQIPNQFSASDLSDPIVLQGIKSQAEQAKIASMPRGVSGGTVAKTKTEKPIEIDKEDAKKISAMSDLNYNIDNLINSIKEHGRQYTGEEAQNQDDLMYGIAASSGVLKGQGAMTESDIKFWQGVLAPSLIGSKEDYINRMKNKKNEYVTGITSSLENKGYTVKKVADGKYLIFDKNENFVGKY